MGARGVWGRADASLRFPPRRFWIPPWAWDPPPDTALELSCWPLAGTGSTVFFGVCSPGALLWGCCELSGIPSGERSSVHVELGGARWLIRAGWARYRMIPTGWSPWDSWGIWGLLWGLAVQRAPPAPRCVLPTQAGRSAKRQLFLLPGGIEKHLKIKTCSVSQRGQKAYSVHPRFAVTPPLWPPCGCRCWGGGRAAPLGCPQAGGLCSLGKGDPFPGSYMG